MSGGLESLEQLTSIGASVMNIGELNEEAMKEVYTKYSFQKKEDFINNLAINSYKEKVKLRICTPSVPLLSKACTIRSD